MFGKKSISVAEGYNNCGECLRCLGNYELAKQFYEKSMQLTWETRDEHKAFLSYLYNNIGLCFKNLNLKKVALPLYEESYKIRKDVYGEKHI